MRFAFRDESATVQLSEDATRAAIQIEHLVRGVGIDSLFVILFPWPEGLFKFEFAEPEDDFIQVTGTAEGMTVELMRGGRLCAVGRRAGSDVVTHLPRLDGSTIEAKCNEVLTPDDAANFFVEYLDGVTIDTTGWSLRDIAVGDDAADSPAASATAASITDDPSGTRPHVAAGQSANTADPHGEPTSDKPFTLGQ